MRVYLGGTQSGSMWREQVIGRLVIDYAIPELRSSKWFSETRAKDTDIKAVCDIHLYTITPMMAGVYNIAETLESCLKYKDKQTVVCIIRTDGFVYFNDKIYSDLKNIGTLLEENGAKVFYELGDAVAFINQFKFNNSN